MKEQAMQSVQYKEDIYNVNNQANIKKSDSDDNRSANINNRKVSGNDFNYLDDNTNNSSNKENYKDENEDNNKAPANQDKEPDNQDKAPNNYDKEPDNKDKEPNKDEQEKVKKENEDLKDKKISEFGQTVLDNNNKEHKIHLLSVIGEIEGHECLPQHNKTTKYEHVLPQLAAIEDSTEIDGLLILINTVGGDVEAGLAIAEMIASLSKPTVSLVLGGSHSIGVPLAVSTDYSFIVPTGTMIIHPVRMSGTVIGVTQTFEYFEKIQDRIISFVVNHSGITYSDFKNLMLDTNKLAKDVGSILVGEETVKLNIINEVGGIKEALAKINEMIDANRHEQ